MDSETIAAAPTTTTTTDISFGEADLISQLPDPLLCSILSRLKIEEAVRTGVLSTRWKSLWRFSPALEFDLRTMIRPRRSLSVSVSDTLSAMDRAMSLVDGLLASHRSALRSCTLVHVRSPSLDEGRAVNGWLSRLTAGPRPVESLEIERVRTGGANRRTLAAAIASNTVTFPEGAFGALSGSLTLLNHVLPDAAPFRGCAGVRELALAGVRMSGETLEGVLAGCGRLERLSLRSCGGFGELRIVGGQDRLRELEVEDLAVERVEVRAPGLRVMAVDCGTAGAGRVALDCPGLREMRVGDFDVAVAAGERRKRRRVRWFRRHGRKWSNVLGFLERCCGILVSDNPVHQLGYNNIPIENLEVLSISLDLDLIKAQIILSKIFRVCHHLKKLHISIPEIEDNPFLKAITNSDHDGDHDTGSQLIPYDKSTFWDMKELSDSLSYHVKEVSVKGFRGRELELHFVSYLIRNAPMLEKLSIGFCPKVASTAARRGAQELLMSLPRASLDVDIIFFPKEIELGDDDGGDGEVQCGARKRKTCPQDQD